jgi:hypothetical protein
VRRSRWTRFAAPAAFLAAVTIGVLIVRAGFEHGRHPAGTRTTTTIEHKEKRKAPKRHHARTYTVQSGDTYASIASRLGTTVARLEQLNPGIDPTALRVGETIRVK